MNTNNKLTPFIQGVSNTQSIQTIDLKRFFVPSVKKQKEEYSRSPDLKSKVRTELENYIHLPLNETAKEFGISETKFKEVIKALDISYWPYRQIRAIDKRLSQLNELIPTLEVVNCITKLKNKRNFAHVSELQAEKLKNEINRLVIANKHLTIANNFVSDYNNNQDNLDLVSAFIPQGLPPNPLQNLPENNASPSTQMGRLKFPKPGAKYSNLTTGDYSKPQKTIRKKRSVPHTTDFTVRQPPAAINLTQQSSHFVPEPDVFDNFIQFHEVIFDSAEQMRNPDRQLSFDELKSYFNKPFKETCLELKISEEELKMLYKKHGLTRWPYQRINYITKNIHSFKQINNNLLNDEIAKQIIQLENLVKDPLRLNKLSKSTMQEMIDVTVELIAEVSSLNNMQDISNHQYVREMEEVIHIPSQLKESAELLSSVAGNIFSHPELTVSCEIAPLVEVDAQLQERMDLTARITERFKSFSAELQRQNLQR